MDSTEKRSISSSLQKAELLNSTNGIAPQRKFNLRGRSCALPSDEKRCEVEGEAVESTRVWIVCIDLITIHLLP